MKLLQLLAKKEEEEENRSSTLLPSDTCFSSSSAFPTFSLSLEPTVVRISFVSSCPSNVVVASSPSGDENSVMTSS